MKAIDYLADFLSEQTKEDRIFIAKSLLDNMDDGAVSYLMFEEVEKLKPRELAWMKEKIDDLIVEIKATKGEKHENN